MAKAKGEAAADQSQAGGAIGTSTSELIDMLKKASSGTVDAQTADLLKKMADSVTSRSFVSDKQATDFMGEEVAGFQTLMIPANMKRTYDLTEIALLAEVSQRQKHMARLDLLAEDRIANNNEVSKRISMMQNSQENKAFDHIWNLEPAEAKAIVAVLEALRGPEGAVLITALEKLLAEKTSG